MTPDGPRLDVVGAAARRQHLLDALAAELAGWGCPDEFAAPRARRLLDVVLDHGYALPTALTDPPPYRGPGSTDEGRARARAVFDAVRRAHTATDAAIDAVDRLLEGTANRPDVAAAPPATPPAPRQADPPVPSRDRTPCALCGAHDHREWAH